MGEQPQNQRWGASMPLIPFWFQKTSLRNSERDGLWSNSTVCKESNLGWLPKYKGWTTSNNSPVLWNPRLPLTTWFKGQRCIIPQTLRQKIKQKLHDSHIGLQGCLCRARATVYWPDLNAEITDYIQKCDACMSLQSNQTKEPLICHEPTSRPWEKVATDIFTLDDENYLCTVDYYSGYFEVDQLHSKTGTVITKKLGDILSHMEHVMNCQVAMNHPLTLQNLRTFCDHLGLSM